MAIETVKATSRVLNQDASQLNRAAKKGLSSGLAVSVSENRRQKAKRRSGCDCAFLSNHNKRSKGRRRG